MQAKLQLLILLCLPFCSPLHALSNVNDFTELNASHAYEADAKQLLARLTSGLDTSFESTLHDLNRLSSPIYSKYEYNKLVFFLHYSYDNYSEALNYAKAIESDGTAAGSQEQIAFALLSQLAVQNRINRAKGKSTDVQPLYTYYQGLDDALKSSLKLSYFAFRALADRKSREAVLLGTEVSYMSQRDASVGDMLIGLYAAYVVENVPSMKIKLLNNYLDFCEKNQLPVKYYIHLYNLISYLLRQIGDAESVGTYTDEYINFAKQMDDPNEEYFATLKKVEQLSLQGAHTEALALLEFIEDNDNTVPPRWKMQGKLMRVDLLASIGEIERAQALASKLSEHLAASELPEPSEFRILRTLLSSSEGNVRDALALIQNEFRRFRFEVTMDRLNYLNELNKAKAQERKALFESRDKTRRLEDTNDLLLILILALFIMTVLLAKMVASKRVANHKLEIANKTDGLTRMYNRGHLQRLLEESFAVAKRNADQHASTLLFVDIDFFKSINDNYGHLIGDEVIKAVASIILDSIRDIDYAGRYGGEEFAVMLNKTDRVKAAVIAQRIRQRIYSECLSDALNGKRVSVSIGFAEFDERYTSLNTWLNAADGALYEAKNTGRNRVIEAKFSSLTEDGVANYDFAPSV